jgi:hypothetical protein
MRTRSLLVAGLVSMGSLALAGDDWDWYSACPDCFPEGWRVEFPTLPFQTDPPPAVLFSGWRNGRCESDLVCVAAPDVYLGNLEGKPKFWQPACDEREVVVFAGGQGPTLTEVTSGTSGVSLNLNAAIQVPVSVWIVGNVRDMAAVQFEADEAARVYKQLGAGIDLVMTVKNLPAPALAAVPDLSNAATCQLAASVAALTGGGYDAASLNVYYILGFAPSLPSLDGLNCYNPDPALSHQEIMFVRGQSYSPMVMAHELGHALGQVRSAPLPEGGTTSTWGDVDELQLDPYLATDNLMRAASRNVKQITLGQIYRMHFDELSWLPKTRPPPDGYPRACQDNPVEGGPCPPLTLHPPRGWP